MAFFSDGFTKSKLMVLYFLKKAFLLLFLALMAKHIALHQRGRKRLACL